MYLWVLLTFDLCRLPGCYKTMLAGTVPHERVHFYIISLFLSHSISESSSPRCIFALTYFLAEYHSITNADAPNGSGSPVNRGLFISLSYYPY